MTEPEEISKMRRYAPQVIACCIKNTLLFTIGSTYGFFTIVIEATTNPETSGSLKLTATESSWFASIFYLFPIIGSLVSGELTDRFGRKIMLICSNIPHLISWVLFYFVTRIELMYFGSALFGFGIGLMEAPVVTYMSEIAESEIRAILIALTSVATQLGIWTSFGLNDHKNLEWRKISLIFLIPPIFSMIALCIIPETPYWLISKKKNDTALKSLQFLRGWVRPETVQEEFNKILRYSEHMNRCPECIKENIQCIHKPNKLEELRQPKVLKPLILIIFVFIFSQLSGFLSMRPYIGMVFDMMHIPISTKDALFYLGMIGCISIVFVLCTIHYTGKRIAGLASYSFIIICFLILAICETYHVKVAESLVIKEWISLITMYALCFGSNIGCTVLGWFLVSEIIPIRTRGIAGGIAAGSNYLVAFFGTKIFPLIEKKFTLHGAFWYFMVINIIAFIFVAFLLPETENRTLEEIEEHFSQKGIWGTKIRKYDIDEK